MSSLWTWLAVAAVGALHGLNPASGWMFAAAWGVHAHDRAQALRALTPIAAGHAASVVPLVAVVTLRLSMDRAVLQDLAVGLLVVAMAHFSGRTALRTRAGHAGLALWSFMTSSAHGAGLMLMPALIPLCRAGTPAGSVTPSSGSLTVALAAVGVHTAAMLAVSGVLAAGICRMSWESIQVGCKFRRPDTARSRRECVRRDTQGQEDQSHDAGTPVLNHGGRQEAH